MTARTGTGATPTHTYAAAGTYTVTLTVTDDSGATATINHPVTVPRHQPRRRRLQPHRDERLGHRRPRRHLDD